MTGFLNLNYIEILINGYFFRRGGTVIFLLYKVDVFYK